MRVTVTGGDGLIGGILRTGLPDRFHMRFLTRADADLEDLPALERAFAGADAVVHLAANADNGADWDDLLVPNVIGVYHAFEAARRAGARRVVYAGSNHAVGMAMWDDERFADAARPAQIGTDVPVRPDSLYGATKAWARPSAASTPSGTGWRSSASASGR